MISRTKAYFADTDWGDPNWIMVLIWFMCIWFLAFEGRMVWAFVFTVGTALRAWLAFNQSQRPQETHDR